MAQRKPKPTDRPTETAVSDDGQIVETRASQEWEGVTYILSHNKLASGKLSRRPYWRAFFHNSQTGKTESRYIGKDFRELREDEF